MEQAITNYLLSEGGIWGLLTAFSFFWVLYVERRAKSKQDNVLKEIQKQSAKIRELELKNTERLEEINKITDERVEDLKEILEEYHKTMNDTATALEKIRFILENKLK